MVFSFTVKKKGVSVLIITDRNCSKLTEDEIRLFDRQYGKLEVKYYNKLHNRYIILDGKTLYHCGASIRDAGKQVVEHLAELKCKNRGFKYLQTDNGPEFRSYDVDQWCNENGVKHVFSRLGKPTDNCFVESFNRILRNECLNVYYFDTLEGARKTIEDWRKDYNYERPQKGLNGLTPLQYKNKLLVGN